MTYERYKLSKSEQDFTDYGTHVQISFYFYY